MAHVVFMITLRLITDGKTKYKLGNIFCRNRVLQEIESKKIKL